MFTKGICYWSFPGGLDGSKPVIEAMAEAKEAGFESIELCLADTGDVSLKTTEAHARKIVKEAANCGIQISSVATGLLWGKSLTANSPVVRQEAIDICKQLIDVAAWLDAGAVLVIPGAVDVFFDPSAEVSGFDTVWSRATEAITALQGHAEAAKVAIGLENVWNKFLTGPAEFCQFIDQFHSEYVGAYFDVGNCMAYGYPEHWIQTLGKRIKRVHLKDFRRGVGTGEGFVDLLAGDVNWPAVLKAFEGAGYDGYLTAEMMPGYGYTRYPQVLIDNTSRAMDAILGR